MLGKSFNNSTNSVVKDIFNGFFGASAVLIIPIIWILNFILATKFFYIYPVILLGDFNDTPVSFTLSTLKGSSSTELFDAFSKGGEGLGATYVGDVSGLRIDYILYADEFELHSFNTYPVELSDHRPISAVLSY